MSKRVENTEAAQKRFDRIAPFYDLMEGSVERSRFSKWRELLWSRVEGGKILEVGVGTGKNFPYYPPGEKIIAVDFSAKMLTLAQRKAEAQNTNVDLIQRDVQDLRFEDNVFDTVVATFVFCSVPDPVQGLKDVARVCKPGGKVVLLEHVLSANRILMRLMNLVNPLVVNFMGPNINRKTVENTVSGGLKIEKVTDLAAGIVKLIESRS